MRTIISATLAGVAALTLHSHPVDFDKITSWAGEGSNRAALVVYDNSSACDATPYVWGFRWKDGEKPTGEDMMKAICAASDELVMLTQYTGQYGATLCGAGVGDADKLLENIRFDFEGAKASQFINFDYYNTSSFFGQEDAPGDRTPEICAEAIAEARLTGLHYIQHPLDYAAYGYPAYDYDHWLLDDAGLDYGWWTAGWYSGYWSYWTSGPSADADWLYSGTGFTGRQLTDGCVDGWSYTLFDHPQVGGIGEGTPPPTDETLYSYRDVRQTTSAEAPTAPDNDTPAEYYTLQGIRVSEADLTPGLYIERRGNDTRKVIIK